jgi:hypothetical protein
VLHVEDNAKPHTAEVMKVFYEDNFLRITPHDGNVESLSVFGGSLSSVEYMHPNTARLQELLYV